MVEADIFNKAVQGNILKPLKNLYIKFDVNTLRHCGEMACVEEYLHTFGNSDITTIITIQTRKKKQHKSLGIALTTYRRTRTILQ